MQICFDSNCLNGFHLEKIKREDDEEPKILNTCIFLQNFEEKILPKYVNEHSLNGFQHLEKSRQWSYTFFRSTLITEGATEKVSQFIMPQKSVFDNRLWFNEQK